jgi:hypothetical protein
VPGESIAGMADPSSPTPPLPSPTPADPSAENHQPRSWHIASWVIPITVAFAVLVVTLVALLAGLEMAALFACVFILAALLVILVWITGLPIGLKWASTVVLFTACVIAEICVVEYDRPILPPNIEAIAFVNNGTKDLGLDMEILVKNQGLTSGYGDQWEMTVSIDDRAVESRQLFGRPLPTAVVNEPELDGEEFPPGKPVRGWLFFEFTSITQDSAKTYFSCGSQLLAKVKFKLSVWDSKRRKEWDETKSLAELGPSACIALPIAGSEAQPPDDSKKTSSPRDRKSTAPVNPQTQSSQPQQPSQTVNAPNGIGAIGSTVINPQVYNYGYMPKSLSDQQIRNLVGLMQPFNDGTDRGDLITSQMGDSNSAQVAIQLVKVFRDAGWNLPGSGYNMALMTNPPQPLLISVHSAKSTPDGKVDMATLPPSVALLGKALQEAGISVAISVDEKVPEGKFRIIVGTRP